MWKIFLFVSISALGSHSFKERYNFGSVIYNNTYQIYRSKGLGKQGLQELKAFFMERGLRTPRTIIHMGFKGYQMSLPIPGINYQSPAFAIEEYLEMFNEDFIFFHSFGYRNRTFLDPVNPLRAHLDIDQMNLLSPPAKKIFGGDPKDGVDGGLHAFWRVLSLVLDPNNQPVLFHCDEGKLQTGLIALAIRYIQGGSWLHVAKNPIWVKRRLGPINNAQLEYLEYNKTPINETFRFIERIQHHKKFQELVERYQDFLNH